MQPQNQYLSNLTPLRGIAALWVVVFHFSEIVTKFVKTDQSLILTKGYLMVDLFFIMSGFIIYHVYHDNFKHGVTAVDFRRFAVARFARVYPLHFFTLLLAVLIFVPAFGWDNGFDSPKAIPTNLLLIHSFGIHDIFNWNVPSWSISAEWWAYMVFPFLTLFMFKKKQLAICLLTLFVLLAYLGIMFWIPRVNFFDPSLPPRKNLDVTFDFGFLRGLAGFITGMILYQAYDRLLLKQIFQKDITAVLIITISAVSMHLGWNDGFNIIIFVALIYCFTLNDGRIHAFCNRRVPQYLGKISYSIYLIQMFPLVPLFLGFKLPGLVYSKDGTATSSFWIGTGYCLTYILVVIAFASLTYYTIEKPCRKIINLKWGREKMPVYA